MRHTYNKNVFVVYLKNLKADCKNSDPSQEITSPVPQITCLRGVGVRGARDVFVLGVQRQGNRDREREKQDTPPSSLQPCSVRTTRSLLTYSHSANLMAPGKGTLSPFLQQEMGICPGSTIKKCSCQSCCQSCCGRAPLSCQSEELRGAQEAEPRYGQENVFAFHNLFKIFTYCYFSRKARLRPVQHCPLVS